MHRLHLIVSWLALAALAACARDPLSSALGFAVASPMGSPVSVAAAKDTGTSDSKAEAVARGFTQKHSSRNAPPFVGFVNGALDTNDSAANSGCCKKRGSSLRVAVLSDLNSQYGSVKYAPTVHAATLVLVEQIRPDLVLITGDMVAGQKAGLDYRAMWHAFHAAVTDPLLDAGIALAPAPGNHDAAPGFAIERAEYVAQWREPSRYARVAFIDASNYPLYYSFEQSGVFFAALDATAVGPLSDSQLHWLGEQLANTNAHTKIVFGHLPNHPVARDREMEVLNDDRLGAIFSEHGVDAYVSGHHHAYYPGAVQGVRHVAMPCLGAGARRLIGHSRVSPAGVLVIDIDERGIESLEAMTAPDFERAVDRHTLPSQISLGRHRILRDDLAFDPRQGGDAGKLIGRARTRAHASETLSKKADLRAASGS